MVHNSPRRHGQSIKDENMHDYSIDKHPKEKIIFGLAFVAIAATPKLNSAIAACMQEAEALGFLGWAPIKAVPVFLLFVALYFVFDKFLWRVGILRRFLLVPDLNGTWSCVGQTRIKNGERKTYDWSGTVTIVQSWSKLKIHLQTAQSSSTSNSASIAHDPGIGYRLLYQYDNDPEPGEEELNKHTGSVEMLINEECSEGDGHYFTDQHRSTVGKMRLAKRHSNG